MTRFGQINLNPHTGLSRDDRVCCRSGISSSGSRAWTALIDTSIITPSSRAELAVKVAGVIGALPLPVPSGRLITAAGQALTRGAARR